MAVTGAIKFFERSKALLSDKNIRSIALSTDSAMRDNKSIENILSFDRDAYYISPESGERGFFQNFFIQFKNAIRINRIMLVDTNLIGGTIVLGANTTNITDINNQERPDGQTIRFQEDSANYFRKATYYFEFDELLTKTISILTTIQSTEFNQGWNPNAPRNFYIRQIIPTREIGTFEGFPNISSYSENQNEIINRTSTGLKHITKQHQTIDSFRVMFNSHPIENDIQIADRLFDSDDSFTLWPCGGGYGSNHFLFEKEGWRLDDIYNVQTTGKKSNRWHKNFYKGGISSRINMVESL